MILYFSGTGNSAYAAKRIGNKLNDQALNLFEKIRSHDYSGLHSDNPWVIVVPTYAWRIPRIVENWLDHTPLSGNKSIYFVMTCGSDIGNADNYLRQFCLKKKMNYRGCMEVVMPENYIAMFSAPERKKALEIIRQAEHVIDNAARLVKEHTDFPHMKVSLIGRLNSGFVNTIFYPMFVHAKKFFVTDACISCGKCVKVCPTENIHLSSGKPVWNEQCTHCMACICHCPKEAIEYGKHSKGLVRYTCPK